MTRLLCYLLQTGGAERDPEAWATRYFAHQGLAATLTLILLAVWHHTVVAAVLLTGYAFWEAVQYRAAALRSRVLLADCSLDWVAWTCMVAAICWAVHGAQHAAAACMVASAIIVITGMQRRAGNWRGW